MLDKEDLQAIAQLIDAKLDAKLQPINERFDSIDKRFDGVDARFNGIDQRLDHIQEDISHMQEDIDILKEDSAITRSVANSLLDWATDASIQPVPLFRKKKPE